MGHQQLYWSHPRKFGQGSRSCRVCSNRHGLIRKYGLNMCRQCFRQYAKDIGFVKPAVSRVLLKFCQRPDSPVLQNIFLPAVASPWRLGEGVDFDVRSGSSSSFIKALVLLPPLQSSHAF
ncbi:40S ribosomal protein S29 [Oryzias melastigma]|uniref:Small ribosomal subunit protein uS14 n=1 Tax=Oryzias melastigma TaxID=30732 RepID=A0A834FEF8_ORYME|nr:40S ribosomal protein S29 [Oryzias melastigma]